MRGSNNVGVTLIYDVGGKAHICPIFDAGVNYLFMKRIMIELDL
ncbi:MAG: hypothetical protein AB8Z23_03715 [Coxiella-like endosymbiont]|nr:hypothetical protein [Coxiella-like endosymbiont]